MNIFLKPLFSLFLIVAQSTTTNFQTGDLLCNTKELKEKAQDGLDPFKYDSSELTHIVYKNKESIKEIEVPLFIGEKYKLVFVTQALPKPVEIQIYNKGKESKNRKLLFSSKQTGADAKEIQFEISKTRQIFINYIVPPVETGSYSGCSVFAIGYK